MKLSLGFQVLIAIVLGVGCGILFGPICKVIQPVAEIYVMLLQMVALPYIGVSLVHGLGSMTPGLGKKLLQRGWPFWLAIWAIVLIVIYLLYLSIPPPTSATFEVQPGRNALLAKNFLNYLVPENPFYDLVNNVVPAIAACGLIFGISLMHLRQKEPVLSFLGKSTQMIEKILIWLAYISPIGIFARMASTFGTIKFEDLFVFEFYVLCFIAATLFMALWALPALVSSLTPLSFRDVFKAIRSVCLLPFATGLTTIAIPFIVIYMKKLGAKHAERDAHFHATSQTVLPICYSFGQIGNCMILFFLFFLSFFFRHPFSLPEKTILFLFSLPMSIGSSTTSISAVSFLIEQLQFPLESIELFMQTLSITMNFQVLVSSTSILSLIILVLYSYYGMLRIKWKKIFSQAASMCVFFVFFFMGAQFLVRLGDHFQDQYMHLKIADVIENPVEAKIFKNRLEVPPIEEKNSFGSILKRGVIRVGYSTIDIPYSYLNADGELVGYDIAFAYQLAKDLDCKLEFIPIEYTDFNNQMINGELNIAMTGIVMDEDRIKVMDFTRPYAEENIVLVVKDSERERFFDVNKITKDPTLKIGVIGAFQFVAKRHFPSAHLVFGNDFSSLFKKHVDAWLTIRTQGFVWTWSHPEYVLIDYNGLLGKRYLAYPIHSGDLDWLTFLNSWLALKEQSGFKQEMIRYWIKGENIRNQKERHALIRDLFPSTGKD